MQTCELSWPNICMVYCAVDHFRNSFRHIINLWPCIAFCLSNFQNPDTYTNANACCEKTGRSAHENLELTPGLQILGYHVFLTKIFGLRKSKMNPEEKCTIHKRCYLLEEDHSPHSWWLLSSSPFLGLQFAHETLFVLPAPLLFDCQQRSIQSSMGKDMGPILTFFYIKFQIMLYVKATQA